MKISDRKGRCPNIDLDFDSLAARIAQENVGRELEGGENLRGWTLVSVIVGTVTALEDNGHGDPFLQKLRLTHTEERKKERPDICCRGMVVREESGALGRSRSDPDH